MTITDVWPIDTCDECKGSGKCQYSEAVSMPEYRCVGVCQYAALAVEQEAVAWGESYGKGLVDVRLRKTKFHTIPLYAAPVAAPVQVKALGELHKLLCAIPDNDHGLSWQLRDAYSGVERLEVHGAIAKAFKYILDNTDVIRAALRLISGDTSNG